jgi:hypothetical protein
MKMLENCCLKIMYYLYQIYCKLHNESNCSRAFRARIRASYCKIVNYEEVKNYTAVLSLSTGVIVIVNVINK